MSDRNLISNYKSYLGNSLLKKSGVEVQWDTKTVEEYIKCSQDVIYFVETYMKIINIDRGLVSFKLYDYQKEMIIMK